MSDIGKAYIQIIPSATGISEGIEKELGASGAAGGASFKQGLMGAVGGAGVKLFAGTAAAAAMAGGAAVKAAGDVAEYGDNIDKMSQKMGISATAYQEWDAIMQHSGASIESLKPAMKTLATQAEKGSDAFAKLGISEEEVKNLSQEDLFARTIAGLQQMEEGTERTYLASQLLGRGGTELGALLNTSAEETEQMRQRVHELGGVMSDEAVKASAKYQDTLQDLTTSFDGVKRNLASEFLPGITGIMDGMTEIMTGGDGFSQISEGFSSLFTGITEALPKVMEMATTVIGALADAFIANLPMFVETGMQILTQLLQGIAQALPQAITSMTEAFVGIIEAMTNPDNLTGLLEAGLAIIEGLIQGVLEALPLIVQALPTIIQNLSQFLIDGLPMLIEALIQLAVMIAEQLPTIVISIIEMLPQIIETIVSTLLTLLPVLVQGAIDLFMGLVQAIPVVIPQIIEALPQIITSIVEALTTLIPQLIDCGVQLFVALVENLPAAIVEIVKALPQIITAIVKGLAALVPKLIECGVNLMKGLGQGIVKGGAEALKAVAKVGKAVVDKAKSLLGIHSPSTIFEEMGKYVDEGFVIGIQGDMSSVQSAVDDVKNVADVKNNYDFGTLKQDVTVNDVKEVGSGSLDRGKSTNITTILDLDRVQLGKVVYELYNEESRRMGVTLNA